MVNVTTQSESQSNKSKNILSASELKVFNERSNKNGVIQLSKHLGVMVISGYLWLTPANWLVKIPALIIYGFSLISPRCTDLV